LGRRSNYGEPSRHRNGILERMERNFPDAWEVWAGVRPGKWEREAGTATQHTPKKGGFVARKGDKAEGPAIFCRKRFWYLREPKGFWDRLLRQKAGEFARTLSQNEEKVSMALRGFARGIALRKFRSALKR